MQAAHSKRACSPANMSAASVSSSVGMVRLPPAGVSQGWGCSTGVCMPLGAHQLGGMGGARRLKPGGQQLGRRQPGKPSSPALPGMQQIPPAAGWRTRKAEARANGLINEQQRRAPAPGACMVRKAGQQGIKYTGGLGLPSAQAPGLAATPSLARRCKIASGHWHLGWASAPAPRPPAGAPARKRHRTARSSRGRPVGGEPGRRRRCEP